MPAEPDPDHAPRTSAEAALEAGLSEVKSEAQAERTLTELERVSEEVPAMVPEHAGKIAQTADQKTTSSTASVIAAAAARVASGGADNAALIDHAVSNTTGANAAHIPEQDAVALQRGRRLLRKALMRRLRPLDAIDAILFLRINRLPHPRPVDRFMTTFTNVMHRGDGYLLLLLALFLHDRPRGWKAIKGVVPLLWLSTATVEFPIKRFFRRRRPFLSIVRAIIVGKKPASYSFPSGHSAAAFAGAELLVRHYPKGRPFFRFIAALVGFSRVYLGAHYPGDVVMGAISGVFFARIYRRIFTGKK